MSLGQGQRCQACGSPVDTLHTLCPECGSDNLVLARAAPRKPPPDCTCHHDCGQDSHSGDWHQHEDELCPVHPEAPVVG